MNDLRADLLADLAPPVREPAAPVAEPAPLPQALTDVTPAVNLQWTPLRWSRPRVVRAVGGTGKALRLGPLTLEVAVKE
jgi:hypothetical protein